MGTAVDSETRLLKAIQKGEITNIEQAKKYVEKNNLWFGPDTNVYDILTINDRIRIIDYDRKTGVIKPIEG